MKILFISLAQCYFTPGITIDGADYRQYVDELQTQRDCAKVCLDDCACMAFVWYSNNNTCLLKSQSINNHMKYASNDVVFGICIVPGIYCNIISNVFVGFLTDSDRDRLWDHVISGYVLAIHEQIDREDCSQLCENVTNATLYSWTPLKTNDDIGACTCLERMTGLMVHFGASSGFL